MRDLLDSGIASKPRSDRPALIRLRSEVEALETSIAMNFTQLLIAMYTRVFVYMAVPLEASFVMPWFALLEIVDVLLQEHIGDYIVVARLVIPMYEDFPLPLIVDNQIIYPADRKLQKRTFVLITRLHYNPETHAISALSVSDAAEERNWQGMIQVRTPTIEHSNYQIKIVEPFSARNKEYKTANHATFRQCASDLSVFPDEIPGPEERDTVRTLVASCMSESVLRKWSLVDDLLNYPNAHETEDGMPF